MSPNVTNRPLTPADFPAVSRLHAKVFGPGRFTRTAYRVREGAPALSPYCRVALLGDRLVAAVRFTPINIGRVGGALLLGPLAVDPDLAGQGFGKRLIGEALEAAKADGVKLVVLVGDVPYYGRFGFSPVPPGQITLPGPVDPQRLLAAELQPGTLAAFNGVIAAQRA
jgi:predicted N-acetyltransferase YhbS